MYGESSKAYQRGNDDSDESEDLDIPSDLEEELKSSGSESESNSEDSGYSCHICGAHSYTLDELQQHYNNEHSKEGGRTYKCRFCSELFENKTDRVVHHALHRDCRYECKLCKISFTYEKSLEIHERLHKDRTWLCKPYSCSNCNRSFKKRTKWTAHLLICAKKYVYKNKKKRSKK